MLSSVDLPCVHRGKDRGNSLYDCSIHGQCSIEKIHERVRPCILCSDRQEAGPETDSLLLGDVIERALTAVGITKNRVENWLGEPCNCNERREKLNAIHAWAICVVKGKAERAREYLDQIISS